MNGAQYSEQSEKYQDAAKHILTILC
jgi:hypothetical protein